MTRPKRSFGSVFRRSRGDGTCFDGFYVRWTDAEGARHQRFGGLSRDAAEDYLAERRLEKSRARLFDVPPETDATLRQFEPVYWRVRGRDFRPQTRRAAARRLAYFRKCFGASPLSKVTRRQVQAVVDQLGDEGYAPQSVVSYYGTLCGVFSTALQQGVIRVHPCRGIVLPPVQEAARPYLSRPELFAIYAAVRPPFRAAVVLIGETGLRLTEAADLLGEHLDLERRMVTVGDTGVVTKNRTTRTVPLSDLALETLRPLAAARGQSVFPFAPSTLGKVFHESMRAAGIERVTMHTLRHAFASGLMRAGVDPAEVMRLLGHRNIQTTMRYARWAPENSSVKAIRALEALRSGELAEHASPPPPAPGPGTARS